MPKVLANHPTEHKFVETTVSRFLRTPLATITAGFGDDGDYAHAIETGGVYYKSAGAWALVGSLNGGGVTPQAGWSVAAPSIDRTLNDGGNTTLQDINRTLGTLINDLIAAGVLTA